eukprot:102572_1
MAIYCIRLALDFYGHSDYSSLTRTIACLIHLICTILILTFTISNQSQIAMNIVWSLSFAMYFIIYWIEVQHEYEYRLTQIAKKMWLCSFILVIASWTAMFFDIDSFTVNIILLFIILICIVFQSLLWSGRFYRYWLDQTTVKSVSHNHCSQQQIKMVVNGYARMHRLKVEIPSVINSKIVSMIDSLLYQVIYIKSSPNKLKKEYWWKHRMEGFINFVLLYGLYPPYF